MEPKPIESKSEAAGINEELFVSFDPQEESWLAGGSNTFNVTANPDGADAQWDWSW